VERSSRISVWASYSLFDLSDSGESFRAMKQRDESSNSAAAYHESEKDEMLHARCALPDACETVGRSDERKSGQKPGIFVFSEQFRHKTER
jgi:hypothetical protein